MNGVNVNNNSINVNNNTQIEREIEIESETEREREIKIEDMKSIYPSNHKLQENKNLDEMMDEMDKTEFQNIISNCELNILNPSLAVEITEILKEMYMTPENKEQIKAINSKKLLYALKNFAIANTKSQIQMPKAYFKKCILSALQQTELSTQYDQNTMYEMESG